MSSNKEIHSGHFHQPKNPLPAIGHKLIIDFGDMIFENDYHDDETMTFLGVSGNFKGATETVHYTAIPLNEQLYAIQWMEEALGYHVVHIQDYQRGVITTNTMGFDGSFFQRKGHFQSSPPIPQTKSPHKAVNTDLPIVGKSIVVDFGTDSFEHTYHDEATMTFKGLSGTFAGVSERVLYKAEAIAPNIFMFYWYEVDLKTNVLQLHDYNKNTVIMYATEVGGRSINLQGHLLIK